MRAGRMQPRTPVLCTAVARPCKHPIDSKATPARAPAASSSGSEWMTRGRQMPPTARLSRSSDARDSSSSDTARRGDTAAPPLCSLLMCSLLFPCTSTSHELRTEGLPEAPPDTCDAPEPAWLEVGHGVARAASRASRKAGARSSHSRHGCCFAFAASNSAAASSACRHLPVSSVQWPEAGAAVHDCSQSSYS
jgi:hypothetical protein